ncbi:MAG: hypothetical protein HZA17_12740 [Nitrospirae bacterium]|nr:hypothetical protein [Nitrospirota bacterium]
MKGALEWLLQRISGGTLLAGLTIHFYYMHYYGPSNGHDQIAFEAVMARLANPYWIAFDIIFLVSVIYHGFQGAWGIALEYIRSPYILKFTQVFIVLTALSLLTAGLMIIML